MMKLNLQSQSLSSVRLNKTTKLPYHQPTVYYLGQLEQVQAFYRGSYLEGPGSWYRYDG